MSSPVATAPILINEPQNFTQKYYQRDVGKTVGAVILSIFTIGIFPLVCLCKRSLWIKVTCKPCEPKVCTAVIFEELVTKKEHAFYVKYFSPDGIKLRPFYNVKQTHMTASPYLRLRLDVGSGWFMQYDEEEHRFMPFSGDTWSTRANASQRPYSTMSNATLNGNSAFSGQLYDDRQVSEQLESGVNWLNKGRDDENEIVGFQKIYWRVALLYIEYVLSAGIFALFCYWQPYLELYLTHRRCNLLTADTILIMAPPRKTKKTDKFADEVLPKWLEVFLSSGALLVISLVIPIGFLLLLVFLVFLYSTLRPYHVRPMKHSSRDGQRVIIEESNPACVEYFKSMPCSEAMVMKFFTWQKVKYVWSGIAVDVTSNPNEPIALPMFEFERQGGLVASDEIDPQSPKARLYFKHQVTGIAPTLKFFHSCTGLSLNTVNYFSGLLGSNKMDLPLTPLIVVFIREILTPFYLFQAFSVIVWIIDEYRVYAYIIIILAGVSAIWQIISIRLEELSLRKTMHKSNIVEVVRPDGSTFVEPDVLVPGDVIIIPLGGCIMQCDAVLQSGTCLVDEAMLTGESVPVLKFSLPPVKPDDNDMLQIRKNERSILFCGTRILQTNNQGSPDGRIRAVVLRTGFMTAKGELTRLILFPKAFDFEFAADAAKFVGIMSAMAIIGMCYSIGLRVHRGEEEEVVVMRSLDIITIAVPPALPIALTIGYMMAQRRLQRRKIYCTSPSVINVAGCIDVVCMDKTGTMTESGLDFEKLLPVSDAHFVSQAAPASLPDGHLLRCLVSCHSLALVDGKAIGDPIEEKMFEMAGWELLDSTQTVEQRYPPTGETFHPIAIVKPPTKNSALAPTIGIVRQLPFSSHYQRMSVVATPLNDEKTDCMSLYLKGAPETVVSICRITTVPPDLDIHLGALTESGYRVLGLATKSLAKFSSVADVESADRAVLERDLDFLGLLVFENKLKPETCGVIEQLKRANIRLLMLTGDNPLTAVSVARQAGIIEDIDQVISVNAIAPSPETNGKPQLEYVEIKQSFAHHDPSKVKVKKPTKPIARPPSSIIDILPINPPQPMKLVVTGASWAVIKQHFPEEVEKIIMRGAVFARVNPNQKKDVIEGLQDLGHYALMCGDGANDCGALRAASTGVSLSQAEASVASTFTSQVENITCVHTLIREGRCALVTSFAIFRFMLLYALIQFISCFILYYARANLSEYGFLYADLFLATTLVFTMGLTEAYDHLVSEKPPTSLLEVRMLLSLCIQAILIIAFQVLAYLYCVYGNHFWFLPFNPPENDTETYTSYEYYSVYIVSVFQYPFVAFVLSKGVPFRKPTFTNWLFIINLLVNIASDIFITFDPLMKFPPDPPNLVNAEYDSFASLLVLEVPPTMEYRGIIFLFAMIFCGSSLLAEVIFVERDWLPNALTKLGRKISGNPKGKLRKFEVLEERIGSAAEKWPPAIKQSVQGAATLFSREHARPAGSFAPQATSSTELLINGSSRDLLSSSSSIELYSNSNKGFTLSEEQINPTII